MPIIKKIGIGANSKDIGSEAQNVDVSYDSSGNIIPDINATGVIVDPTKTKSAAKAIQDIKNILNQKADLSELDHKAHTRDGKIPASELPSYVDDIIEGYYNSTDGKFYKDNSYTIEINGEADRIYLDLSNNLMYRWDIDEEEFITIADPENMNLNNLTDVNISSSLKGGQSLVYNGTNNKWENREVSAHIIKVPLVVGNNYTYEDGIPQGPLIKNVDANFNNYVTTSLRFNSNNFVDTTVPPAYSANAGSYTLRFSIKNQAINKWSDGTTAVKFSDYVIDKAEGSITLEKYRVTLNKDNLFDTINVTEATGEISVSSSNESIAIANYSNGVITITAKEETGNCTVTVNVAADQNHNATSTTIDVSANFITLVGWNDEISTDEQITAMINDYYNGKITLDQVKGVWAIGDSRKISLSAINATNVGESHRAQDVQMVILDFEHDILTTSINGKTEALISIGQKDCLMDEECAAGTKYGIDNTENGYMNSSRTNEGGWTSCARRTWCNNNTFTDNKANGYYAALPPTFKGWIKQVKKFTGAGNRSDVINIDNDYIWLPSEVEVFDTRSNSELGEGIQYSYYQTINNKYKLPKWNTSYLSSYWRERSPARGETQKFCIVNAYGDSRVDTSAIFPSGIVPHCCL